MIAIVTGTGVTETVSIATDILTLTAVIVHVLAHLNMTRTLQSVAEQFKTGRPDTGTATALACLRFRVATAEMMTATNALAAAPWVIIMDVSAASVKWSASDLTLAEPILVRRLSVFWTMVTAVAALHRPDAVVTATRAPAGAIVRPRYVKHGITTSNEGNVLTFQRARYSPRADRKSKTPVPEPVVKKEEEDRALRSGSEEGEIEED